MRYSSVTSSRVLNSATQIILRSLRSEKCRKFRNHKIVFRPSHATADVMWLPRLGIWFAITKRADHFWFPLGVVDPKERRSLPISVEMNTPRQVGHKRAALVLQNESGQLFLAHTGRIGGGSPGINRTTFLQHHGPTRPDVVQYDGKRLAILVGDLASTNLPLRISRFVQEVAEFKIRPRPMENAKSFEIRVAGLKGTKFKPKFTGEIKRRARSEEQIKLLHDLVCTAVNEQLPPPGGFYDQRRDLFCLNNVGTPKVLFEVKTDVDLGSIYKGVGQLLLNGLAESPRPKKLVLVVPGHPDAKTLAVLNRLKIVVLSYAWKGDIPVLHPDAVAMALAATRSQGR